jgi:hypothetical protein
MAWQWISGLLTGSTRGVGLFEYLASRDRNRTRVRIEGSRRESMNDLLGQLPYGAVYRETANTKECRREVWMPPPQAPVRGVPRARRAPAIPVLHHESADDPFDPAELPGALKPLAQGRPVARRPAPLAE